MSLSVSLDKTWKQYSSKKNSKDILKLQNLQTVLNLQR